MPTVTQVNDLKINKLTKAQYDEAVQSGVIGENEISIITDLDDGQVIQVATLPTASADELDNIYQFIGTTDANYTNGYFYKCVSDGADPATYSWEAVEVQASSGGLPDQTGNAGKFLKTNGSEVSWGEALVNMATHVSSLQILGVPNLAVNATFATVVGQNAHVFGDNCTAIGYNALCDSDTTHAIQLGEGRNADSNTFKVANANGNFELMSADGTIPKERLVNAITTPSTIPELTVAGWSNNTQTVTVTGVTAINTVIVSPIPTDAEDYAAAGILCTGQATNALTFTCKTIPARDLQVNIVIM